ncbi:MAG: hypothetical protein OEM23_01770 [Gemmatimonadota bacterium]|nr:hypothetical protein [Gemmatimonadota bacterium]MDH3427140.1 hypothetical protein [Gemmatimonadota bacterium]
MRSTSRNLSAKLIAGLLSFVVVPAALHGQVPSRPVPVDTSGLASGPYPAMSMKLEKTLFKVDVLTLELWFAAADDARVRAGAALEEAPDVVYEAVAAAALEATDVWARIRFLRGVSLGQFLDAAGENLQAAREAGLIDDAAFAEISEGLPVWYSFLRHRRVRKHDEMHYRIRGDTLRTVFVGDTESSSSIRLTSDRNAGCRFWVDTSCQIPISACP